MIRNKRTGEIVKSYIIETAGGIGAKLILQDNDTNNHYQYNSLSELYEEWEDVQEEPKEYWFIADNGLILSHTDGGGSWTREFRKEIGNYFETKEEAKEAVEKLRAWKRLKDKGVRFTIYTDDSGDGEKSRDDLDLLFGGEE